MRTYEIKAENDGWEFNCEIQPHPLNGTWKFTLVGLEENDAHKAAIFARANEQVDLVTLYEQTERLCGREPYGGLNR